MASESEKEFLLDLNCIYSKRLVWIGCFAGGSRILMSNGTYKDIQNIKVGDFVIDKDGDSVRVINTFNNGYKKVIKIRHNKFYKPTYVTPNHKYLIGDLKSHDENNTSFSYSTFLSTLTRNKKSKIKWNNVDNKNPHTYLIPKNIDFDLKDNFNINIEKYFILSPKYKKYYNMNTKSCYELGYIFGTFLGDGHVCVSKKKQKRSRSSNVNWTFGKNEIDIANKLCSCIKEVMGKSAVIKYVKNTILVTLFSTQWGGFFGQFGKKRNKHLLEKYLINDKKYLQGIFDGLVDSDGHVNNRNIITFANTSHKLIELFNIITYLLYDDFPNNSCTKTKEHGNFKSILIYHAELLKHKRQTDKYIIIKKLKTDTNEIFVPVYDIETETHSFICNNAIVHNSGSNTEDTGVNRELSRKVVLAITSLDLEKEAPITLIVNCCGGEEMDGIAIYDIISMCRSHITAVVCGEACSAASTFIQAADERLITPNSYIMIHDGSISIDKTVREAEIDFKFHNRVTEQYRELLNVKAKINKNKLKKLMDKDTWLNATEALELGLVDKVIKNLKDIRS